MKSKFNHSKLINRCDLIAFLLFAVVFVGQTSYFFESPQQDYKHQKLCFRAAILDSQADSLRPTHCSRLAQSRPINILDKVIETSCVFINTPHDIIAIVPVIFSPKIDAASYLVLQVIRV